MKNRIKSLLSLLGLLLSMQSFSVPMYNSQPNAVATLYLDFDGHRVQSAYWNGGAPLQCASSGLTDVQITEIFNRVAEDFRPFDVNVTTDSTKFLSAPLEMRMRIIVTSTSNWRPNVGGISYITSFSWGDDTPGFVFSDRLENNTKYIAECCSHEIGHTLGLFHQARYNEQDVQSESYHTGNGSGEIGWAPIMGNSYGKNMSSWNLGPSQYSATENQDNLEVITTENGFGFRMDDFENDLNESAFNLGVNTFLLSGVISTNMDVDAFQFQVSENSRVHLEAKPGGINAMAEGVNMDIQLSIYNDKKERIGIYNPEETAGISADITLNAGKYYITIEGVGNANMSDYSSLGSYTIEGTTSKIEAPKLELTGIVRNIKHQLETSVETDEDIALVELENSENGNHFERIRSISPSMKSTTTLTVNDNRMRYYRLKRTSKQGAIRYSKVIALSSEIPVKDAFEVNSFVQNNIRVQATEPFQFGLYDVNGGLIKKGNGTSGTNQIDLSGKPNGVYIIRLVGGSQQKTIRLVKQ
jgi:hypothetical protein